MSARPHLSDPVIWHFPEPEIATMPNGLAVWAFDLPGQHVIAADLVIDVPLALEPSGLEGVGVLAGRVADEGTAAHPGSEIAEALELSGAALSSFVGHAATLISLDVPSTRLESALDLMAEVVREPSYDPSDVTRHIALRHSEIEHGLSSAPATAAMARRLLIHPAGDRYHLPAGGTHESIDRIAREDLVAFHDTMWRPDHSTLVVAGELPGELLNLLAMSFGSWGPAARDVADHAPGWEEPTTTGTRRVVHLVDRPEAVQAEVRIVGPAPDRTDPDLSSLQVAASAIGGSFLSRLNALLREELGYTYGAHLSVTPQRHGGTWNASWSGRTEVTADAIERALDVLALHGPLTPTEIHDAVNQIIGVAPLRYETAGGIAQQARALASVHQPATYPNAHFRRVAATTADRATGLAREHIRPDRCWLIVVGPAEQLAPELEAHGFEVRPVDLGADLSR